MLPLLEVGEEVEVVPFVVVVFGVAVEIDGPTLEHFSINIAYLYIHQKRRGEEERRRGGEEERRGAYVVHAKKIQSKPRFCPVRFQLVYHESVRRYRRSHQESRSAESLSLPRRTGP